MVQKKTIITFEVIMVHNC